MYLRNTINIISPLLFFFSCQNVLVMNQEYYNDFPSIEVFNALERLEKINHPYQGQEVFEFYCVSGEVKKAAHISQVLLTWHSLQKGHRKDTFKQFLYSPDAYNIYTIPAKATAEKVLLGELLPQYIKKNGNSRSSFYQLSHLITTKKSVFDKNSSRFCEQSLKKI
jgi:hypothetical protein